MKERLHAAASLLLAFVLLVSSPIQILTSQAAVPSRGGRLADISAEDESWIVPALTYKDLSCDSRILLNKYNMEVEQRALVTKNADGSYRVRLKYSSYPLFDFIQVVDPEQNEAAMEAAGDMTYLKWGDFNVPSREEFDNADNYDKYIEPKIDASYNGYYYKEAKSLESLKTGEFFSYEADPAMHSGYLEFNIDDLSQNKIIVKPCYTMKGLNTAGMKQSAFVVALDMDKREALPSLAKGESYELGNTWTAYIKNTQIAIVDRGNDLTVKEFLDKILEPKVSVTVQADGTLAAAFTLSEEAGTENISSVELAESRNLDVANSSYNAAGKFHYTKELIGTSYSKVLWDSNSEDKTFTISFKDIMDGKQLRVSTQELDAANASKTEEKKTYYYATLFLTEEIRKAASDIEETDPETGVRLTGTTSALPDFESFEVETLGLDNKEVSILKGLAYFAKSEEDIKAYQYSIKDSAGKEIQRQGSITVDFPIPESFDLATTSFGYKKSNSDNSLYGLPSNGEVIEEKGKRYVRLTLKDQVDYTIVIYDQGSPMTAEELASLEEGYYKVRPTLGTISDGATDRPSMSAVAVKDKTGILEVVKKGEEYNLYLDLNGVEATGYGYVYEWYTYYGEENNLKKKSEVLSYKTGADLTDDEYKKNELDPKPERTEEEFVLDVFNQDYGIFYAQRIKMPLENQKSNSAFKIGLVVPLMNAFTSAGILNGIKSADVRLIKYGDTVEDSVEKIDGTDLVKYSRTLLRGMIQRADWLLEKQGEGTSELAKLKQAREEAYTAYKSMDMYPDTETLLKAVETLESAWLAAGGSYPNQEGVGDGSYEVPYSILVPGSEEVDTAVAPYFTGSAQVEISEGEMTVTLPVQPAGGDYPARLEFSKDTAFGEAETQVTDGHVTAFTFKRPYTEEKFEIALYTENAPDTRNAVNLKLEMDKAEAVYATEEQVQELNALLEEFTALNADDYTKESYENAQNTAEEVRLGTEQVESIMYGTWKNLMNRLNTAKDSLVYVKDLKERISEGEAQTSPSGELTAAIAAAKEVVQKDNATKEEVQAALSELNFLLGKNGSAADLTDGYYRLPFAVYEKGTGTAKSLEESLRYIDLKVSGNDVVLYAAMEADGTAGLRFGVGSGAAVDVTALESTESGLERWAVSFQKAAAAGQPFSVSRTDGSGEEELRLDYTSAEAIADRQELYEKLTKAWKAQSDLTYTDASRQLVKAAAAGAETVLDSSASDEEAIEAAASSVGEALLTLTLQTDADSLNQAIEKASGYLTDETAYTQASWLELVHTVESARELTASQHFTHEEAEAQIAALEAAILALEYQSRADLGALLEEAGKLKEIGYTADSWSAFAKARTEAEAVYEDTGKTDQEYKDALELLKKAKEELKAISESEALEGLKASVEELEELTEDPSQYEETSYDAFDAAISLSQKVLDNSENYTEDQILKIREALEAEAGALIRMDEINQTEAVSYTKIHYDAIELEEDEEEEEITEAGEETEAEEEEESGDGKETEDGEETKEESESAAEESGEAEKPSNPALPSNPSGEVQKPGAPSLEESGESSGGEESSAPDEETEGSLKPEAGSESEEKEEPTDGSDESADTSQKEDAATDAGEQDAEESETNGSGAGSDTGNGQAGDTDDAGNGQADDTDDTGNGQAGDTDDTGSSQADDSEDASGKEDSDSEDPDSGDPDGKGSEEDGSGGKEESGDTPKVSLSVNPRRLVMAAPKIATPGNAAAVSGSGRGDKDKDGDEDEDDYIMTLADVLEDGVYCVDYSLWQFSETKESMGNPALKDSYPDIPGKQAKIVVEDGTASLYIEFQEQTFDGKTGHLESIFIMDDIIINDGVVEGYTQVDPKILETFEEGDDYGPQHADKYPKRIQFEDITEWMETKNEYIPVQVFVPVMGTSGQQNAYIRCYWSKLKLLEAAEPEVELEKDELEAIMDELDQLDKTAYTAETYEVLMASAMAGDFVLSSTQVSQEMIDSRVAALEKTRAMLIERTGGEPEEPDNPDNPDNPDTPESSVRDRLSQLLTIANGFDEGSYSTESFKQLKDAKTAAMEVLMNENATDLQLERAYSALNRAIEQLLQEGPKDQVDKTVLDALIASASGLISSNYSESSWLKLTTALTMARAISGSANATQAQVDEQVQNLRSAINALQAGSEENDVDSDNSGSDEDDGYYKVKVDLYHASMSKKSMGDPALDTWSYVYIDGGDITMRLVTKKMTTSGITTHLYDFWIYDDGDYEEADLVSTENSKWIFEFALPNDNNTYYKCKVDPRVDVMGDDPVKARLRVNWDSLKEVDEDDWDDLEGSTDDDDDDDDSSTGSSSSSSEMSHAETGIRIQGNVGGPGVVMEASRKTSGSEFDRAHTALNGTANQLIVYDIKLRSGSDYVQPKSAVTLKIPIPAGYDTKKLLLYRINDDGSSELINGKVNGSYYEASVEHFSLYALVESNQVVETETENKPSAASSKSASQTSAKSSTKTAAKASTKSGSSSVKESSSSTVNGREIPYTGDRTPVESMMCVSGLSLLLLAATMLPRKKRKEEE